ncbi:MAG: PD-(D/E)XK nuclease family protein [Candidatus Izimaplasma sp.]|nr:PD-(D/E)XK nuclease family protein [Candidatus Izimaplasma bacterium]
MKNIKISVKKIVNFILSGGDLTSEFKSNKRAVEGQEIHKYMQDNYYENDEKEVFVETLYDINNYSFHITGRIDGVLKRDGKCIIEEIKSTKLDLNLIKEDTRPEHLAQVKMYAYMYLLEHQLKSIRIQLTYVKVSNKQTKIITKRYNMTQLTNFFEESIKQYTIWLERFDKHNKEKETSIEGLTFPFEEYREGQYTFMGAVYQTLLTKDIVYSEAPTGIGKTVGALFAGLKTIKNDREKIMYLTAKNAGKEIAKETINLLKENGLVAKTVILHSKEEMCLMDKVDCDPEICPYAKGYFDRVQEALEDIFIHDDVYDQKLIKQYGEYHEICPHEFSLSISYFSDIIICDYNYAFDPRVHLIRYFDDDYYTMKLLIDEAHNMIDRSRSMFSATLKKSTLTYLKEHTRKLKPKPTRQINRLVKYIDEVIEQEDIIKARFYFSDEVDASLITKVESITKKFDQILVENKKFDKRKQILECYFELMQFLRISDFFNDKYKYIISATKDNIYFTLNCLDASEFILDILKGRASGTVFFSATLQPIDYYVNLITNTIGKSIHIPSPFPQENLGLFLDASTSTRYKDRDRSIDNIIDTIYAMLESHVGNYIAFFPSYNYLNKVLKLFDTSLYDTYIQKRNMTKKQRDEILEEFTETSDHSKIGFFVLGGSFSEGVDYPGEKLSGVLVVGVAFPMFNKENELLRSHFDNQGNNGFEYAYTYPGFNKVIQAVGRVIRTKNDRGVAILFDDRYLHHKYQTLFPSNWAHIKTKQPGEYIQALLREFWDKIKKE